MPDPRASNPAYEDPYLASVASNIGKMFSVGNMGRTIVQRAQAQHYQLQNDKLAMEAAKRSAVANVFRNSGAGAIAPEQFSGMAGDAIEGGITPADLGGLTLYRQSNTGQPDSVIARSFVGAGHGLNKGEGVSLEDREGIRTKDAANSKAASDSSASIHAGATIAAANIAENGRMARRWDAPHNTQEGAAVNYNPADPRFAGGPASGSVLAPKILPPHNTPEGNAVNFDPNDPRFEGATPGAVLVPKPVVAAQLVPTADPDNPDNTAGVWAKASDAVGQPKAPGRIGADKTVVVEGKDGKPVYMRASDAVKNGAVATTAAAKPPLHDIRTPKAMQEFTWNMLSPMGVVDSAGRIDPEFMAKYGAKVPAAQQAAANAPDVGSANAAFFDALGIPPGSTWSGGHWYNSGGKLITPEGSAPAPAPAAAPAAVVDPLEGRTATGPGGQKVMRRGGQWVPVQ